MSKKASGAAEKAPAVAEQKPDSANSTEGNATTAAGEFPRRFRVTNNTPIPLYLAEAGVSLASNFNAPANTAVVTYQTEDAFKRETSNIATVAKAHGFEDVLTLEDVE